MHPATGPGGEAQGYGLKVNLECLPESPLPTDVDGVPLRVEIVGAIRTREVTAGR